MYEKEDAELFFSDESQDESVSYEGQLENDIDHEIQTHVFLFRRNKVLELQGLLETKLTQEKWCQLCDAVLNDLNLETFLLLPKFLRNPTGFICFDENLSIPVMDYLFSRFFVISSFKTLKPIVKHLFENKLISDSVIHNSFVSIITSAKVVNFALILFLFETEKIDYDSIHKEDFTKILTTNICISFLDNCFKGCWENLKLLESMPKILPKKLIDNLLTEIKTDKKSIEGFHHAKKIHAFYPASYDGFKKFWFRAKVKDGPQKHWLASQLFFNTPVHDCIPAVQNNFINSYEEDMVEEFNFQPKSKIV